MPADIPHRECPRCGKLVDPDGAHTCIGGSTVMQRNARTVPPNVVSMTKDEAITFLWDLLDDIDTAGDMAKGDDKLYRSLVERYQQRRWETPITTDGYDLDLSALTDDLAKSATVCPDCGRGVLYRLQGIGEDYYILRCNQCGEETRHEEGS